MPDIALEHIVKSYGAGAHAVDDLNLTIDDGDFMCLLGPSGCGKTTTVRMIAGLEHATAGTISIGGTAVDQPARGVFVAPEKRDVGLVFQSYALWPHLTVRDNVDYGLKLRKKSRAERERILGDVMHKLGIAQYRDRFPSQLSGGQQQRVALARMLAVSPELMLLDEPLSNLDSRLRLEMRAELKRIHEEFGATIVFVTHDQWEAMTLATRIAVMNQGVLQQVGTPMDIYDRPVNRFVANFLGVPPMNFIELGERVAHPAGGSDAPTATGSPAVTDRSAGPGATGPAAEVEAAGGPQREVARAYLAPRVARPDELGSLGIRPESLTIVAGGAPTPEGALRLDGDIESVMPTGGSWTIQVSVGSQSIYATVLNRGELARGQRVALTAPAANLHVFDTHDERMTVISE